MQPVLEDKDAIRELLARYCFHIDSGKFDEWVELFTEDGVFEVHGLGRFAGRTELRRFLDTIPIADGVPQMKHCVMNEMIEVNGDRATSRCYLLVARGGDALSLGVAGRYEDDLRRVDGEWRFARRKAYLDFMNR